MSNVTPAPVPPPAAPTPAAPAPPEMPLVAWLLLHASRIVRGAVILLVVAAHLVILAIRNPLDLWEKDIREELSQRPISGEAWGAAAAADPEVKPPESYLDNKEFRERFEKADRLTNRYVNMVGFEQDWCMFAPEMARKVDFLAVRLEFEDNSAETILSPNEPKDPACYFRVGGWQVRKMENYLMKPTSSALRDETQRQFYEGYVRHVLRHWQAAHPDDPRRLESVVLIKRSIYFPAPDRRYADVPWPEPGGKDLAVFDARGRNGRLAP
jgi:hypothetical protein